MAQINSKVVSIMLDDDKKQAFGDAVYQHDPISYIMLQDGNWAINVDTLAIQTTAGIFCTAGMGYQSIDQIADAWSEQQATTLDDYPVAQAQISRLYGVSFSAISGAITRGKVRRLLGQSVSAKGSFLMWGKRVDSRWYDDLIERIPIVRVFVYGGGEVYCVQAFLLTDKNIVGRNVNRQTILVCVDNEATGSIRVSGKPNAFFKVGRVIDEVVHKIAKQSSAESLSIETVIQLIPRAMLFRVSGRGVFSISWVDGEWKIESVEVYDENGF